MKKNLFVVCTVLLTLVNVYAQETREISIDFSKEKGKRNNFFQECIGAGRANEGLRADWQQQLVTVQNACDFKFIRFHGIFHDDMGVYTENDKGEAVYNWQYVDKLYDFILETGLKPFVELSFTPSALASGEKTVFWWKGNITPPKSLDKYNALVKAFVQHLTERYGEEEVKSWYFEVWNEPDHPAFYGGKMADYLAMYKSAVDAIRSVSQDYRVGGPATAGIGWVDDFLEHNEKNNVPVDFVSAHGYNVHGFLDEFGTKKLRMDKGSSSVINKVKRASKMIKESKTTEAELHFTEWSSSYSPADPIHDTYQNAAFVINTLKNVEEVATSMSYWVFTDIFEEPGVPRTPFHGGFGLLNLQGIKKPTFYVYSYLNQLGDTELVNADASSWAAKQDDDFQLLLWNFKYLDQGKEHNQEFFRKHLKPEQTAKVDVNISNLKNGAYELVIHKTGYKHNDPFTAYFEMGKPDHLSKKQTQFLKNLSSDNPIKRVLIEIKNGTYKDTLELNDNDMVLIKINKL